MWKEIKTRLLYPNHGKKVIFMRKGELNVGMGIYGEVMFAPIEGNNAESQVERLQAINEAANALNLAPIDIEIKLREGDVIFFREQSKSEPSKETSPTT